MKHLKIIEKDTETLYTVDYIEFSMEMKGNSIEFVNINVRNGTILLLKKFKSTDYSNSFLANLYCSLQSFRNEQEVRHETIILEINLSIENITLSSKIWDGTE